MEDTVGHAPPIKVDVLNLEVTSAGVSCWLAVARVLIQYLLGCGLAILPAAVLTGCWCILLTAGGLPMESACPGGDNIFRLQWSLCIFGFLCGTPFHSQTWDSVGSRCPSSARSHFWQHGTYLAWHILVTLVATCTYFLVVGSSIILEPTTAVGSSIVLCVPILLGLVISGYCWRSNLVAWASLRAVDALCIKRAGGAPRRTSLVSVAAILPSNQSRPAGMRSTLLMLTPLPLCCLGVALVMHGTRNGALSQAMLPSPDAVLGEWRLTNPSATSTDYSAYHLWPGPTPDLLGLDLAHPVGDTIVASYVAVATQLGNRSAIGGLVCACMANAGVTNATPAYLFIQHHNGVVGFVPRLVAPVQPSFDAERFVGGGGGLTIPDSAVATCFAQAEDSRSVMINMLHGAVHSCFCFALFASPTEFRRFNRWAWGTPAGWTAERVSPPLESVQQQGLPEMCLTSEAVVTSTWAMSEVLSWALALVKWPAFVMLSFCPAATLNAATAGVAYTALVASAENPLIHSTRETWSWFNWVKRLSLVFGWIAVLGLMYAPGQSRRAHAARTYAQLVLCINVLEAGLLMVQNQSYAIGIGMILVCPFSPAMYQAPGAAWYFDLSAHGGRSLLGMWLNNPLHPRWYFRIYYLLIGVMHFFDPFFENTKIHTTLTCLIPFVHMELFMPEAKEGARVVTIFICERVIPIVWIAWIDSFAYTRYQAVTTGFQWQWIRTDVAMRNVAQMVIRSNRCRKYRHTSPTAPAFEPRAISFESRQTGCSLRPAWHMLLQGPLPQGPQGSDQPGRAETTNGSKYGNRD